MDPQSFLGIDPEILRRLAAAKLYGPAVRGTLPPDPAYGPVPPSQRPAMGSYMAAPMPTMPTEPPMKPPAPVTVPAPAPGARAAGVPSAPPPTAAAPPAGLLSLPQPVSPMVGAPQAVSPLLGGGALPELPAGGMAAAGDESGGFLDWLAKPELASALMEMGARMLAASAPSTNPASGSFGYALGQGVGGFGAGMDKAREQKRQEQNDQINELYKLAMVEDMARPDMSAPETTTVYTPQGEQKMVWNAANGQWEPLGGVKPFRASGGGVGGPGGQIKFGDEIRLRQEYLKSVKDVAPVYDGWQRVKSGAGLNSGPGDMSMIFGYMKMLDPGSVVREGEYANAKNAAGVPEYLRSEYNRLIGGGILSEEQRKQFLAAAEAAWMPYSTRLDDAKRVYGGLAQQYGMDPTRITVDPVPQAVEAETGSGDLKPGDEVDGYRYLGGDPSDEASWEPM